MRYCTTQTSSNIRKSAAIGEEGLDKILVVVYLQVLFEPMSDDLLESIRE